MRRDFRRALMGMPGLFFMSAAVVVSCSALAWGLWSAGSGVGLAGLMSVESQAVRTVAPVPQPTPAMPEEEQGDADADAEAEPMVSVPTPRVEREPQHDSEAEVASPDTGVVTFDGRPLQPVRQMDMKVTAYSPDARSCGDWADGWTASGYSVWTNGMKLVAADTSLLPFGTIVSIPGYNNGEPVQVLDVGGAIKGNRLDVLYPTHERARQWGVQQLAVTVWEYAD